MVQLFQAVADAVPDLDSVLDELRQVRAQQSAGRDQSSRELQDQNQLLTEQNGKLRLAITDMRSEMEAFASVQASMADQVAHLKDANQVGTSLDELMARSNQVFKGSREADSIAVNAERVWRRAGRTSSPTRTGMTHDCVMIFVLQGSKVARSIK